MKYEGVIDEYSFVMRTNTHIEVWSDKSDNYPLTFFTINEGDIKSEKDFHTEISYWFMENRGLLDSL